MKRILFLLIFILSISALNTKIFSQTADEIIDRYAEAMGGADKLLSVNSLKFSGTVSARGNDLDYTLTAERNGKARTEINYQGMQMVNACDGNTGWTVNPFSGTRDADMLPPEEVKTLRKKSEFEGELINYREKGYKAEFLEKDDFEGSEVYKIKLTDNDGDVTYYFIDLDTYLLLMSKSKRKIGEKEITSETIYGNYKMTGGIMFPMSLDIKTSDDRGGLKINCETVEINAKVDDSIFKMPGK
ncbi:MAG: hypothetical protein JSS91_07700 [Bacteroidetes bacterium]|nr:hypothetical protein [Bacteroidota bacterium]